MLINSAFVYRAKGNGRAMNNVRGAQGCLIIAWFLTLISWAMLVQALHFTTTKKVGGFVNHYIRWSLYWPIHFA